jgi:hypothetical protein
MVACFINGKNIRGMLHYNENKVAAGEAMLLLASGFAGDSTPVKSVKFNLLIKFKPFS